MPILTDGEVEDIMISAMSAIEHVNLPKKYRKEFLLTFRSYIEKGGIIEDVCPECLGSGRRNNPL